MGLSSCDDTEMKDKYPTAPPFCIHHYVRILERGCVLYVTCTAALKSPAAATHYFRFLRTRDSSTKNGNLCYTQHKVQLQKRRKKLLKNISTGCPKHKKISQPFANNEAVGEIDDWKIL
ncbi:hypothetical protein MATL_G00061020 [Megalops atlanticus]|uniref:Uncharacterized protein n=1 Tax=Megalops atlanticus TaxID=7932 RepID=A0A9D3Q6X2_MEGAT|nr:hypothetical protein MATL_G00061020 [Megalops atlanticus]